MIAIIGSLNGPSACCQLRLALGPSSLPHAPRPDGERVLVTQVPMWECERCGLRTMDADVAARIERLVRGQQAGGHTGPLWVRGSSPTPMADRIRSGCCVGQRPSGGEGFSGVAGTVTHDRAHRSGSAPELPGRRAAIGL